MNIVSPTSSKDPRAAMLISQGKLVPDAVRCDFCGRPFTPQEWNCRTCVKCAVAGAPDQSKGTWSQYDRKNQARMRASGVKAPLGPSAFPRVANG